MYWRAIVAATVLAGTLGACSSPHPVDEAASDFCVKARDVARLDVAVQHVDDSDRVAAEKAWDAYLTGAKDMGGSAPKVLKVDYAAYVTWVSAFQQALSRHDYKYADAIDDPQFISAVGDEKMATSHQNVTDYIDSHCHPSPVPQGS